VKPVGYRVMGPLSSRSGRMPARAGRPTRETSRRSLEHFLTFTRDREGRVARVSDLNAETIHASIDEMAKRGPRPQHDAASRL